MQLQLPPRWEYLREKKDKHCHLFLQMLKKSLVNCFFCSVWCWTHRSTKQLVFEEVTPACVCEAHNSLLRKGKVSCFLDSTSLWTFAQERHICWPTYRMERRFLLQKCRQVSTVLLKRGKKYIYIYASVVLDWWRPNMWDVRTVKSIACTVCAAISTSLTQFVNRFFWQKV